MSYKCKCKRKVLRNNVKETLKLSHTVITFEKLIMKVKNKKTKGKQKIVKEVEEDYPVFREQLKERIVPCCGREDCKRGIKEYKRLNYRHAGHRVNYSIEERIQKRQLRTPDKEINEFSRISSFEDISSGSLSTDSYEEIDRLVKSTRKRMRNSDEDWILMRRPNRASSSLRLSDYETLSINTSFESLDTLLLEPDENLCKLKHEEYFPKYSSEIVDDKKNPDIKKEKIKVESISIDTNNFLMNVKKECKAEDEIKAVVAKLEKLDDTASTASGFDTFKVKKELYADL